MSTLYGIKVLSQLVLILTYLYTMEQIKEHERIINVDMDGVLCDFDRRAAEIVGKPRDSFEEPEMWSSIESYGKARFFETMEWMPGGRELWNFVTANFLKVRILSALGKSDMVDKQTSQGKLAWLRHNIPDLSSDDIILVQNKHKKRHYAKPGDIMIDDNETVIHEWLKKGGIGILHKTAQETISKLKEYV